MRRIKTPIIILFFVFSAFANGGAPAQTQSDIPGKLGLSSAEAKTAVVESLGSGYVWSGPAFQAFKALPPAERGAFVRAGLAWIKDFTRTAEFKAEFAKYREGFKPAPPPTRLSAEEEIKKQKDDFEKEIAETQKSMAGLDAETRKAIEESIKAMRAQMDAWDKDPEQKAMMKQALEMQAAQEKEEYANRLKEWEEAYPVDPNRLIVRRINEFLKESEGVDFGAKLVRSGSKMKFALTEYEEKPAMWKLCYRAGKEAVEAARTFATAWLAELEK